MDEKKEVQVSILPQKANNETVTEEEFLDILKMIAPGTNMRAALDGALRSGKGALIAVENEKLLGLLDGGFRVNCRFTPQRLVELSKMDGAIVLSSDLKRINYANVLLTPDSKIKSSETGTRHKAAERTAKQIGDLVIAISERKHEINIFYKNTKYNLKSTDEMLRKANAQLTLLEKHREIFDKYIEKLNRLEMRNYLSLSTALQVIQKGKIVQKLTKDLKRNITELGNEAIHMRTRLKELTSGVEKEMDLVIKDYTKLDVRKSKLLLDSLSYDDLLESDNILRVLAYESFKQNLQLCGWRILSKTSLEDSEIALLIKEMSSLGKIIHSPVGSYKMLLGEEKAQNFKDEIERMKLGQI
jgi:diadenylate cyclase